MLTHLYVTLYCETNPIVLVYKSLLETLDLDLPFPAFVAACFLNRARVGFLDFSLFDVFSDKRCDRSVKALSLSLIWETD